MNVFLTSSVSEAIRGYYENTFFERFTENGFIYSPIELQWVLRYEHVKNINPVYISRIIERAARLYRLKDFEFTKYGRVTRAGTLTIVDMVPAWWVAKFDGMPVTVKCEVKGGLLISYYDIKTGNQKRKIVEPSKLERLYVDHSF